MPPKKVAAPAVAILAEPDPISQLPNDLPSECPFAVQWSPMAMLVLAPETLDLEKARKALWKTNDLKFIEIRELIASLDATSPLAQQLEAGLTAHLTAGHTADAYSAPAELVKEAVQVRFVKDEQVAWKFEFVKRRDVVNRVAVERKAAQDYLAAAKASHERAEAETQKAKELAAELPPEPQDSATSDPFPLPVPAPTVDPAAARRASISNMLNGSNMRESVTRQIMPTVSKEQLRIEQLARQLAAAEEAQADALAEIGQAEDKLKAVEERLAEVEKAMLATYNGYQPYWLYEGPSRASKQRAQALIDAGINVRAIIWLRSAEAGGDSALEMYAMAKEATAAAGWKDSTGSLAVVDIVIGTDGTPFSIPLAVKQQLEADAAAAAAAVAAAAAAAEAAAAAAASAAAAAAAAAPAAKGAAAKKPVAPAAKGAAPAPAADAPAPDPSPQDVPGLLELLEASKKLAGLAVMYDDWRRDVKVYPLEAEPAADMNYYSHLLDAVVPEQASIPVLLHGMLEQVARNMQGEAVREEADLAHAILRAAASLDRAFAIFRNAQQHVLTSDQGDRCKPSLAVLQEGDGYASAAAGFTSGFIHAPNANSGSPRSPLDIASTGSEGDSGEGVVAESLLAGIVPGMVEKQMLQLLQQLQQQQCSPSPVLDAVQRSLWRTAVQAHGGGLPAAAIERYCMLRAAALMLPEGVQEAHGDDILTRHHYEHLAPQLLTCALSQAATQYPRSAVKFWAQGDASLVAFFADAAATEDKQSVYATMTFAEYVNRFVEAGGSAARLAPAVYASEGCKLQVDTSTRFLYPSDGCIVKRSALQPFHLMQGTLSATLQQGQRPALMVTTDTGATITVTASDSAAPPAPAAAAAAAEAAATATDPVAVAATTAEETPAAAPEPKPAPAIQCYTPHGWVVEVDVTGRVLMASCQEQQQQIMRMRGVDVHGAPVPSGELAPEAQGSNHLWRAVNSDGSLVTCSLDNTLRVLHLDGSTSVLHPSAGGCWTRTNAAGDRWTDAPGSPAMTTDRVEANDSKAAAPVTAESGAAPAPPTSQPIITTILCVTSTDPDSKAEVTTREDGVMVVRYQDGTLLVVDGDGTRIVHGADGSWRIEAEHLPTVAFDGRTVTVAPCPGVEMTWSAASSALVATFGSGASLVAAPAGLAAFSTTAGQLPHAFLDACTATMQPGGRAQQVAKSANCRGLYVVDLRPASGALSMWEAQGLHLSIGPNSQLLAWQQAEEQAVATGVEAPEGTQEGPQADVPGRDTPCSEAGTAGRRSAAGSLAGVRGLSPGSEYAEPVAPHVTPRLFVVHRSGEGFEILSPTKVNAYLQRIAINNCAHHDIIPTPNADEPGTLTHTILTSHPTKSPTPPALPLGPTLTTSPYVADHAPLLPALRRPSATAPASTPASVFLPRLVQSQHTAVPEGPEAPVLVYREITELPPWNAEQLLELEQVLQKKEAAEQLRVETDAGLEPVPEARTSLEIAAEEEVAVQLQALRLAKQQRAEGLDAELAKKAGEEEAAAFQDRADELARTAAMVATGEKDHRAWPRKSVPFEDTPKRPPPTGILKYFDTEEGITARSQDRLLHPDQQPITKACLPPRLPAPPASTGRMGPAGVYISEQRAAELKEASAAAAAADRWQPLEYPDGDNGVASAAGPPSTTRSPPGRTRGAPKPQPLPVDYTHPAMGRASPTHTATIPPPTLTKTHAYNIYGSPRTAPVSLPSIYSPDAAPLQLNTPHIDAEGATLRLNRTAPMALIHTQGRGSRQFQLSPSHLHFGTVTLGSVVHRAARLLNTSGERQRFSVVRPDLPLRVIYKPGPVAAGMEAVLTVEFVAGRLGDFVGGLTVKSELNVISVSCSAKVVELAEGGGGAPLDRTPPHGLSE